MSEVYVARCSVCGGVRAGSVDDGSPETDAQLSEWVKRGLIVGREKGPVAISCTCLTDQSKPVVIAE